MKHYAERDVIRQGQHYINHVEAMTAEGLHSKADIAAELAHRDIEIERLRKLVTKGLAVVHDFLPNIGRCALQDYQRMVLFCVEAGVIGVTAGTPGDGETDSVSECSTSGDVHGT